MKKQLRNQSSFSKFIQYVLGYHPDEFGLITDDQGFVHVKTLLQALHEDPEWRFVRWANLNELLLTCRPSPIEIRDHLIRAQDRTQLPRLQPASEPLPKLLYTPIRRRSHAAVAINGMHPYGGLPYVILTTTEDMALRLGRRIDPHPVLISIPTVKTMTLGVAFKQYGGLYLTGHLPVEAIIVPPLVKPLPTGPKTEKKPPAPVMKTPGSYFVDPTRLTGTGSEGVRPNSSRKPADWKKERRKARKHKRHMQTPES